MSVAAERTTVPLSAAEWQVHGFTSGLEPAVMLVLSQGPAAVFLPAVAARGLADALRAVADDIEGRG